MQDDNDILFDSFGPDLVGIITNLIAGASGNGGGLAAIYDWLLTVWEVYSIIAFIISLLLIIGIIYSYIRMNQLSEIEHNNLLDAEKKWRELYGGDVGNSQWNQLQSHINSENPNDWKLSIIEADIMLDNALTEAGYAGVSVGEKLKSVSPQSMRTIRDAWDAHMIRNKVAHGTADFVLTQKIAQEAIVKYGRVFRELEVL